MEIGRGSLHSGRYSHVNEKKTGGNIQRLVFLIPRASGVEGFFKKKEYS